MSHIFIHHTQRNTSSFSHSSSLSLQSCDPLHPWPPCNSNPSPSFPPLHSLPSPSLHRSPPPPPSPAAEALPGCCTTPASSSDPSPELVLPHQNSRLAEDASCARHKILLLKVRYQFRCGENKIALFSY